MVMDGSKFAIYIQKLLDKPELLIGTTLLGTNLSTVGANFAVNEIFSRLFGTSYSWASAFVIIPLILFFGEILPKSIFRKNSENFSHIIIRPLKFFSILFWPMLIVISFLGKLVRTMFTGRVQKKTPVMTREEFRMLLDQENFASHENQTLRMLENLSNYIEKDVGEIAIPMINVTHCEPGDRYRQVLGRFLESGFSKIPVYDKDGDELTGFINDLDLLETKNRKKTASAISKDPLDIPENLDISRALLLMRKKRREIAAVMDEYGGTAGIVTLKDIVSEITGKLTDKDEITQGGYLHKISNNVFIVDSLFRLDELEKQSGVKIKNYPFETVNGLMNLLLRRVAKKGDICSYKNLVFRVLRARPQRADMIKVQIKQKER